MKVNFPLKVNLGGSQPDSGNRGVSLKLPVTLPYSKLGGANVSRLQSRALRAIAAAVCVIDPGKALEIAREAEENPEDVIGATLDKSALDKLKELSAAISAAERNIDELPSPPDLVSVVARAVNADAKLAEAAISAMREDCDGDYDSKMFSAALNWVAAIDYRLLQNAPREGVRERLISILPETLEATAALEERVTELEASLKATGAALEKRLKMLESEVKAMQEPASASAKKDKGATK